MVGRRTSGSAAPTERQKARVRMVVLTLVGIVCPPLAGAGSAAVWIVYCALAVGYAVWALRLARRYAGDRRVGYVLCATDAAVLLPLLAWRPAAALWVILPLLWTVGLVVTHVSATGSSRPTRSPAELPSPAEERRRPWPRQYGRGYGDPETMLEGALRLRLQVLRSDGSRFALVLLRVLRFDEIGTYYGMEVSEKILVAISSRGLRLLGPDAQVFHFDDGVVAFVFSTGLSSAAGLADIPGGRIDPYDVESLAMAMGRKACEHLVDGQKVECVVGWASAPADGVAVEDLLEIAEGGARSTAAFRRVAGDRVPVPERTRAAAG